MKDVIQKFKDLTAVIHDICETLQGAINQSVLMWHSRTLMNWEGLFWLSQICFPFSFTFSNIWKQI